MTAWDRSIVGSAFNEVLGAEEIKPSWKKKVNTGRC